MPPKSGECPFSLELLELPSSIYTTAENKSDLDNLELTSDVDMGGKGGYKPAYSRCSLIGPAEATAEHRGLFLPDPRLVKIHSCVISSTLCVMEK